MFCASLGSKIAASHVDRIPPLEIRHLFSIFAGIFGSLPNGSHCIRSPDLGLVFLRFLEFDRYKRPTNIALNQMLYQRQISGRQSVIRGTSARESSRYLFSLCNIMKIPTYSRQLDSNMKEKLKTRDLYSLLLGLTFFLLSMTPTAVEATHSESQPSDGTVRSFRSLEPPREPPYFEFQNDKGQIINLASFRGKVLLLNIWATWCAPCIREMPALDRLQAKFDKKDFVILPISLDRAGRLVVEAFYRKVDIRHLGIYLDPKLSIQKAFPIDVLPANFLVNQEGRVTGFLQSFVDWDAPEAENMIRRLISFSRNTN
jgi:thiol-disulfide isomerase/thioredoxin